MPRKKAIRKIRLFLVMLLATIAIVLFYREVRNNLHQIPTILHHANPYLAALIVLLQVIAYGVNASVSNLILRILGIHVRFRDHLRVSVTNELGNNLVPILGGSITTYYGYARLQVPKHAIVLLSLTWLLLLVGNAALFMAISLAIVPAVYTSFLPLRAFGWVSLGIGSVAIVFYFIFQNKPSHGEKIRSYIKTTLHITSDRVREAFELLAQRPALGISAVLLSAFYFFLDIAMLVVAFNTFGQTVHVSIVTFGFILASLFSLLTLVPSSPGVMEGSLLVVFTHMGLPAHVVLFATVLFRLLSYWIWVPLSGWFLGKLGYAHGTDTPGRIS